MTVIKRCEDLELGETFIWANQHTRNHMGLFDWGDNDMQVLRYAGTHEDNEDLMYYRRLDGSRRSVWFNETCYVIVVDKPYGIVPKTVRCLNCGRMYRDHFPGEDARTNGIECEHHGSKKWFVPNEEDLGEFFKPGDDFFAELGL